MRNSILLCLALLSVSATQLLAETRLVPGEFATIQQAIQASNNGDVVVVEPGTYFENINFLGRNITVTSTDPDDPDIVAGTVINGNRQGSVVTFESGETFEAVLTGFTITGGYGTEVPFIEQGIVWGSGIFVVEASPTIKGNLIANNDGPVELTNQGMPVAVSYGVGISCIESASLIINNTFRDNSGYAGGAIMTFSENNVGPMIISNLMYDNSALVGGRRFCYTPGE